jgi:hypothetical protein
MVNSGQDVQDRRSEKREHGVVIGFVGLALIVADLLVLFFAPAAFRLGQRGLFTCLIVVLAVAGLALLMIGRRLRQGST